MEAHAHWTKERDKMGKYNIHPHIYIYKHCKTLRVHEREGRNLLGPKRERVRWSTTQLEYA